MSDATLTERLTADMNDALRARDRTRLAVIRRLRAVLKNAEIDAGGPLPDDAVVRVLRTVAKQHRESIEQFAAGGRDDLVERERAELAILQGYLPAPPDAAAVERAVRDAIVGEGATGLRDMGRVMRAALATLGGAADGRAVSEIARRLLSSG